MGTYMLGSPLPTSCRQHLASHFSVYTLGLQSGILGVQSTNGSGNAASPHQVKPMSKHHDTATPADQAPLYEIRLKGHLGREWTDWFGGMAVALTEDGDTLLTGPVTDQAALFGLLRKVRDLGLPLVSINEMRHEPSKTTGEEP